MAKRVIFCIPAVAGAVFTIAIEIGAMKWALAANVCIEEPNRQAAPGGHWFFRTDSVNNRKCWHLVEPQSSLPQAEAPKAGPSSRMSQAEAARAEPPEPSTRAILEEEPPPHAKFLRPFSRSEFEPIEE